MLQIDIFLVEVIKSMCLVSRFTGIYLYFFLMEKTKIYFMIISSI